MYRFTSQVVTPVLTVYYSTGAKPLTEHNPKELYRKETVEGCGEGVLSDLPYLTEVHEKLSESTLNVEPVEDLLKYARTFCDGGAKVPLSTYNELVHHWYVLGRNVLGVVAVGFHAPRGLYFDVSSVTVLHSDSGFESYNVCAQDQYDVDSIYKSFTSSDYFSFTCDPAHVEKVYDLGFWDTEYDDLPSVLNWYRTLVDPFFLEEVHRVSQTLSKPLVVVELSCGHGSLAQKLLQKFSSDVVSTLVLFEANPNAVHVVQEKVQGTSNHETLCHLVQGDLSETVAFFTHYKLVTGKDLEVDFVVSEGSLLSQGIEAVQKQFDVLSYVLSKLSPKGRLVHVGVERFFMTRLDFNRRFPSFEYTTYCLKDVFDYGFERDPDVGEVPVCAVTVSRRQTAGLLA